MHVTSLMLSSLGEASVYLRTVGRVLLLLLFLQPCVESNKELDWNKQLVMLLARGFLGRKVMQLGLVSKYGGGCARLYLS